jgi:hypothetical protein
MCTVSLIRKRGSNVPEVGVELCTTAQLFRGGKLCDSAAAEKQRYKEKYKETVRENATKVTGKK